ncbi:hypothetical protein SAMN05660284_01463 [Formivibrio citricus]|uniref:Uncharacterized protein n=1 Tax=Formivibrio citricus TaxID=83765 RepID=A0A1I4YYL3_9NEIS|nr:hypothetical protein [Formivibrio citricus]SFN43146.1 hypothetical protein SAMN05660284_01463 [Formivibrio citricus]
MLLTSLPPDRHLVASLTASPVVSLLTLPELRTYRLERALMPRAGSAKDKKTDAPTFGWLFAERVLLSPAVLLMVSLFYAARAWFAALPAIARHGLALTLFLLVAGLTEPVYAPHSWSDPGSFMTEGRMGRAMRHRVDLGGVTHS